MNPADYSVISFPFLGLEVNPPRSFSIGSLDIHLYGLVIALGLLLAVAYAGHRCKCAGLTQDGRTTGGGPGVSTQFLSTFLYTERSTRQAGYASAIGMVILVIAFVLAMAQVKIANREKGKARARANPAIPMAGPAADPIVAA